MNIRKATTGDFKVLSELLFNLLKSDQEFENDLIVNDESEPFSGSLITQLLDDGDSIIFVAEKDHTVVGFVGGLVYDEYPIYNSYRPDMLRGELRHVFVEAGHRRQGIATLLIRRLMDWFSVKEVGYVNLFTYPENSSAVSLYKKLGFNFNEIEMKKRLS